MCRFINSDAFASTGQGFLGYNMFAYCCNNPVNQEDIRGEFGLLTGCLIGALIGVVGQYVGDVVSNAIEGKTGKDLFVPSSTPADYIAAGVSGALAATGIGKGLAIAANTLLSTVTYTVDCGIKGETVTAGGFATAIGAGILSGVIGGSGVDVGGKGAIRDIATSVISTTSSTARRAMYQSKLTLVYCDLAIGATRTFASVAVPNILTTAKEKVGELLGL